jgi:hypothetical protein
MTKTKQPPGLPGGHLTGPGRSALGGSGDVFGARISSCIRMGFVGSIRSWRELLLCELVAI